MSIHKYLIFTSIMILQQTLNQINPTGGGPPGHLPRGGGHFVAPLYVFPNIFEMPGCIKTKFSTQQGEQGAYKILCVSDVASGHSEVKSPIIGSGFAVSV